jgi:hypothetical protein
VDILQLTTVRLLHPARFDPLPFRSSFHGFGNRGRMSAEFLLFTNNAVVKRHDVGCKPQERLASFEYHEVSKDSFRVNSKNAMYFQYVSDLLKSMPQPLVKAVAGWWRKLDQHG